MQSSGAVVPVLVLNWNGWDDTIGCLQSLRGADGVREVWLVDNGSRVDRSAEIVERFPHVRYVPLGDNFGWAGGYNRAMALAAEEGYAAVYLLNNDTVVDRGFLRSVRATASAAGGDWASVGSRILYSDGTVKFDGRYHPSSVRSTESTESLTTGNSRLQRIEAANGSGMLVNLSAWSAAGPFDEAFFCYGEEYEWCVRAADRGFQNYVAPDSLIWHKTEGSDLNANAAYYRARNLYLLAQKRAGGERRQSRAMITYHVWRWANEARRTGEQTRALALVDAIWDGWTRRYGKRRDDHCPRWLRVLAYTWPFPPGFFRGDKR